MEYLLIPKEDIFALEKARLILVKYLGYVARYGDNIHAFLAPMWKLTHTKYKVVKEKNNDEHV